MAHATGSWVSLLMVVCACRPEPSMPTPSAEPDLVAEREPPASFVEQTPVDSPVMKPALIGSVAYLERGRLPDYTVKLCLTETVYEPCPTTATFATTTTNEQGEYRFLELPEAEFWVRVEGLEDCDGLFYETTIGPFSRAETCVDDEQPCDLGQRYACRRIPPCVPPH